jgi:hypothetical protein
VLADSASASLGNCGILTPISKVKQTSDTNWIGWLRKQSGANPSLVENFPASWENAGNFADLGIGSASKTIKKDTGSIA